MLKFDCILYCVCSDLLVVCELVFLLSGNIVHVKLVACLQS